MDSKWRAQKARFVEYSLMIKRIMVEIGCFHGSDGNTLMIRKITIVFFYLSEVEREDEGERERVLSYFLPGCKTLLLFLSCNDCWAFFYHNSNARMRERVLRK